MKTLRCGLIGDHIGQTRFPAALGVMCRAAGIGLRFELIDTADRAGFDLSGVVDDLRKDGWDGVSVTHPFKQAAAQYAGQGMPAELARLGAANTLVFGPSVQGFNTDYTGFLAAWEANMGDVPVGCVALAGAGGVARAIGPALATLGAREIRIRDISQDRAKELADLIGDCARVIAPDQWSEAVLGADGLVNATPIGMTYRPGSAFDLDLIGSQAWAFDAVYTPTDTGFLIACARAGLTILTGFEMFRHMALHSFQAYTGVRPDPVEIMPLLANLRPD